MKELISTCPCCLRIMQGECEFCKSVGVKMAKTLTNDDMNPSQTVEIVTENCGKCRNRFNTTSDAQIYFCPYCNHRHLRVGLQVNKPPVFGANDKKMIEEVVEGITKEIEALKTKLARKEIELETLKLVRGMMK